MAFQIETDPPVLSIGAHDRVRVAGTRVYLEFIVEDYNRGMTAEQIAEQYDVITLADVYAVLSYYLRHKAEVDAHVAEYEAAAAALEAEIRASQPPQPTREELLARRAARIAAGS